MPADGIYWAVYWIGAPRPDFNPLLVRDGRIYMFGDECPVSPEDVIRWGRRVK